MPTVTRITSTGTLMVNGSFDEVNGPIVTTGLRLWLEAENPNSYSGTGTAWNDLSGNGNNGTLVNSPAYFSASKGNGSYFSFGSGATQRTSFSYQTPVQSAATAFTWNIWAYPTANSDSYVLMGYRGTTPIQFYKLTTQKFEMYPAEIFYAFTLNQWNNICVVYDGSQSGTNNMKMYVNGLQVGLRDADQPDFSPSAMPFYVGGDPIAGEYATARISSVQVYNRALTVDEITQNYNARRQVFALEATSSTTVVGKISMNTNTVFASVFDEVSLAAGSVVLTGGKYLSTPSSTQFGLGNGDFTIEGWFLISSTSSVQQPIIDFRTLLNDSRINIWIYYSGTVRAYIGSGTLIISSGFTPTINTQYHIALTRSGSNTRLFINGIQYGTTYTTLTDLGATSDLVIGTAGDARGNASYSLNGAVSNVRIIKGTALYTANFTPPQTVLDVVSTTSLLLNILTSENFIKDNSPNNFTITNTGGATFSSTGAFNQGNFTVKQRQLYDGKLEISGMFDETTI
jgi:hypothetical protein